jgi:SAM-dependent methyltransferase
MGPSKTRPSPSSTDADSAAFAVTPLEHKPDFGVLACPETGQRLVRRGDKLVTADGRRHYPVVREVPRFVPSDLYVGSFSFEWNTHKHTQLDSYGQDPSSEEMFRCKTGLTPEQVDGKLILDAGIGAGRFTDILVRWGARVVGVDLSYAVEAAQENFGHLPQVLVCQADIARLPFRPGSFDFIISIGVLHHTPDTRRYFSLLPRLLKPGGEIAIWVYPREDDYLQRNAWIPFTSRIPSGMFYRFCKVFVPWAQRHSRNWMVSCLKLWFPYSEQGLGLENDILDTFDGFSPRYHGIHSPEDVEAWFHDAGLVDIRHFPWNTAVRGCRAA